MTDDALRALTARLNEATTLADVTDTVIVAAIDGVGACAATIALLSADGDWFEQVQWRGFTESLRAKWSRVPVALRTTMSDCLRSRQPVLLESHERWRFHYPDLAEEHLAAGCEATATLPLVVNQQICGVLNLGFSGPREFGARDIQFLMALAAQAAGAIARTSGSRT